MIDFHSHILPGIDDGSRDEQMSLTMLQMEKEQGVTEVVVTPHFYAQEHSVDRFLRRRTDAFERLQAAAGESDLLLPPIDFGAEVYYFPRMGDAAELSRLCIGESHTILIELPFMQWDRQIYEDVEHIISRQELSVVLAHIERYIGFQKDHGIWDAVMELPLTCQMNAGPFQDWKRRRRCLELLRQRELVLLGSDAHNVTSRRPNLRATAELLNAKVASDYMNRSTELARRLLEPV